MSTEPQLVMAAVETQLAAMGMRLLPVDKLEYERNLADLRANMDEKVLTKFRAKGKAMSLDELTAFALQGT